jgi:mono/diheme cytochrome c family protein
VEPEVPCYLSAVTTGLWFRASSRAWLGALGLAAIVACGERERGLREWTPADHQPAPGGAGVPDEEEGPGAGAALFAVHCAGCHGAAGAGDGPAAPPMARVPNLRDPEAAARRSDADVEAIILRGRGMMPGFASALSAEGVQALVRHVRTLAPPAALPTPEPPEPAP